MKSDIKCWDINHLILLSFTTFILILFIPVQVISGSLLVDNSDLSVNYISRKPMGIMTLDKVLRAIIIILDVLRSDEKVISWSIMILIIVSYGYMVFVTINEQIIYYYNYSNKVFSCNNRYGKYIYS